MPPKTRQRKAVAAAEEAKKEKEREEQEAEEEEEEEEENGDEEKEDGGEGHEDEGNAAEGVEADGDGENPSKSPDDPKDGAVDGGEEKEGEPGKKKKKKTKKPDEEEEEEELEATEEELEEERKDAAVRLIQGLYRTKKARRMVRELVRANFVKEYDEEHGQFKYRNKRTGLTTWTKPLALGDEDLPDPKGHIKPDWFNVKVADRKQCALVIHNTKFEAVKLPNLDDKYLKEHEELEYVITHPYLCKFLPEDCMFSPNITLDAFMFNFDSMKRAVESSEKASFFLYICTHCIYVQRGLNRGSYLMFCDSNPRSADLIRKTGLSISALSKMIKEIQCEEKTVVLDITHEARPKGYTGFRSKLLYPPRSVYDTIANSSGAVVIGSCKLGPAPENKKKNKRKGKNGKQKSSAADDEDEDDDEEEGGKKTESTVQVEEKKVSTELGESVTAKRRRCFGRSKQIAPGAGQGDGAPSQEKKKKDKGIEVRKLEDGTIVVVDIWDQRREYPKQAREYVLKKKKDAYDQSIGAVKLKYKNYKEEKAAAKKKNLSKYEVAQMSDEYSLFGEYMIKGLAGAAGEPSRSRISVRQLFTFVKAKVMEDMKGKYALRNKIQTPMLAMGKSDNLDKKTSVCTIPSEPPAPTAPEAKRIKFTSILIEWTNPAYSGSPPLRYEVQVRGSAKYNKNWVLTGEYAVIEEPYFLVPHLTTGLEVQFQVRAFNYGGWSQFSDPSRFYVPETQPTLTVRETIAEAADMGLLNLLLALKKNSTDADAIALGFKAIATLAVKQGGFTRGSVGKQIVDIVLEAMRTYKVNAEVQAYACLVLGWACYGHPGCAEYAERKGVVDAMKEAAEKFPTDASVHSNMTWAMGNVKPASKEWPADVQKALRKEQKILGVKYLTDRAEPMISMHY